MTPGESTVSGTGHRVKGGYGDWVSGGPSVDTEREGSGWETALGNHGPLRGAKYLQDGLPDRRGIA